jgi:hypothetical protein
MKLKKYGQEQMLTPFKYAVVYKGVNHYLPGNYELRIQGFVTAESAGKFAQENSGAVYGLNPEYILEYTPPSYVLKVK